MLEPVFRCVDADRRGWDDDNCEKETDPRRVMLSLANPLQNGKTYDMTFSEGLSFTVLPDADRPSFELPEGWEGRTSALAKPEVIFHGRPETSNSWFTCTKKIRIEKFVFFRDSSRCPKKQKIFRNHASSSGRCES